MTNSAHSMKHLHSKAHARSKNVPKPKDLQKEYGWRNKSVAGLRWRVCDGSLNAAILLYHLQRIMTHEALHTEGSYFWWICTGKELARRVGLTPSEYKNAVKRLKDLKLIEVKRGPHVSRPGLLQCTHIRIKYETLHHEDQKALNKYNTKMRLATLDALEHDTSTPLVKRYEALWRYGLPEDKAKDFHGFDKAERNMAKHLTKKVPWPILYQSTRLMLSNWYLFRHWLKNKTSVMNVPYDPELLTLSQHPNEFINCWMKEEDVPLEVVNYFYDE